ncbi:MAG: helix-turn-helix transcriptional regulator [Candidatus Binatia bacterium]|nr:helix-turn-helix transcriptional regulator [Candidatus Binatia bacterium]
MNGPEGHPATILASARQGAGLSLRAAAERAGTSHSTLVAYEKGRKTPTVTTFLRLLTAFGYATDIELSPRIREQDGYPRGDELRAVLELAAHFPTRHTKTLRYPKFGAT